MGICDLIHGNEYPQDGRSAPVERVCQRDGCKAVCEVERGAAWRLDPFLCDACIQAGWRCLCGDAIATEPLGDCRSCIANGYRSVHVEAKMREALGND